MFSPSTIKTTHDELKTIPMILEIDAGALWRQRRCVIAKPKTTAAELSGKK